MGIRISRRQLALAAAGVASSAQAQTAKVYGGALEGLEGRVDTKTFDPVRWTLQRHDSAALELTFNAKTRKQAETWQKQLRSKVVELVGGFPSERSALKV